jgi:hypothetical protein
MYGISASMIERAITSGELPVSRLRRSVIIRIKDAEKWIGKSKARNSNIQSAAPGKRMNVVLNDAVEP